MSSVTTGYENKGLVSLPCFLLLTISDQINGRLVIELFYGQHYQSLNLYHCSFVEFVQVMPPTPLTPLPSRVLAKTWKVNVLICPSPQICYN